MMSQPHRSSVELTLAQEVELRRIQQYAPEARVTMIHPRTGAMMVWHDHGVTIVAPDGTEL